MPNQKFKMEPNHYWSCSVEEILTLLGSSTSGIRQTTAAERLRNLGPNEIPRRSALPWWVVLMQQFNNPLIYILLAAAVLKFFIKGPVDAAVIVVVVILMTMLGFFQEMKAHQAMTSLMNLVAPKAKVRREGKTEIIPYKDLVVGDILVFEAGDRVPADARLIEASHLTVGEAALTGESLPVEKTASVINGQAVLSERTNMVYMGTVISVGRGVAVVTATGAATEIGKIAKAIAQNKQERTPLQQSIDHLGRMMLMIVAAAAFVILIVGTWQGMDLKELIVLLVAAAVSAIPEGLPAAVTVVLAVGMQYMARRNAVIRKLLAVETLGASTVICTDKTGTLTLNQMTVRRIFTPNSTVDLSGAKAEDRFKTRPFDDLIRRVLHIGVLCNDAVLIRENGRLTVAGDPTEGALLSAGLDFGMKREILEQSYPRRGDIPFNSKRKWMATLHQDGNGQVIFVKGALEKMLEMSDAVLLPEGERAVDDAVRRKFQSAHDQMAEEAMRVLAVGYVRRSDVFGNLSETEIQGRVVLCGLIAMVDPPRPEAVKAVSDCRRAGIRVVMITGDSPQTAAAIGKEIGLSNSEVLTGKEVSLLNDQELRSKVRTVSIFARIDPLDKLRIVTALQEAGEIVAMTGDGVNDASALEKADIGVAMGITGTDVAKEASDMVLSDDNFASIVCAVEEGRAIFNRLRNVTAFLMTTCLGELLMLILALTFMGVPPLEPIQILWINVVTGALLAIPLGLEPRTGQELSYPPRRKATSLVYKGMMLRILFLSVLLAVSVFLVFQWCAKRMPIEEARTIAFSGIIIFEWLLAFSFRSDTQTAFELGLLKNKWLVRALLIAIGMHLVINYAPVIHSWFYVMPMKPYEWGLAMIPGVAVYVIELLRKRIYPRLFDQGKW